LAAIRDLKQGFHFSFSFCFASDERELTVKQPKDFALSPRLIEYQIGRNGQDF